MKTLVEIKQIREEKRKELDLRVNLDANTREKHILVCRGTGCTSSKSPKIIENFRRILEEKGNTNYKRELIKFSKKYGIVLNLKKLFP